MSILGIHDYNNYNNILPLELPDNKKYIIYNFNGQDELHFEIPTKHEMYKYLREEVYIDTNVNTQRQNQFVIKNVDEHSDFVTIKCLINLDDWKQTIFEEFRRTGITLTEALDLIKPNGWFVSGAGQFIERKTVEVSQGQPFVGANPYDILIVLPNIYDCQFNYNVTAKTITVIDTQSYTTTGEFFTDELNLKSLGFVGNSNDYITRLYAYGSVNEETGERLTFASINDGKPYVEDYTYSNKLLSIGWSDERYNIKESLLEDAKTKLKLLSTPKQSYECSVINLADDIWLYKVVTLIDRQRGIRVNHQVVQYKEYERNDLDVVTLSTVASNVRSVMQQIQSNIDDGIRGDMYLMERTLEEAIEYATERITGNLGGHFIWIFDSEGKPQELVNLGDTEDINTAKKVWRWNASGLGHSNNGYIGPYDLALLDDGSINASQILTGIMTANLIKAGRIADLYGYNYWDLETGEFSLRAGALLGGSPIVNINDLTNTENILNDNINNTRTNLEGQIGSTEDKLEQDIYNTQTTLQENIDGVQTNLDESDLNWRTRMNELEQKTEKELTEQEQDYINRINELDDRMHQDLINSIDDFDESLNQQNIFNRLTNYGEIDGIFMQEGQLYINASYIKTGTMSADLIQGGILRDRVGNLSFNLDTGLLIAKGLSVDSLNLSIGYDGSIIANDATITSTSSNGYYKAVLGQGYLSLYHEGSHAGDVKVVDGVNGQNIMGMFADSAVDRLGWYGRNNDILLHYNFDSQRLETPKSLQVGGDLEVAGNTKLNNIDIERINSINGKTPLSGSYQYVSDFQFSFLPQLAVVSINVVRDWATGAVTDVRAGTGSFLASGSSVKYVNSMVFTNGILTNEHVG